MTGRRMRFFCTANVHIDCHTCLLKGRCKAFKIALQLRTPAMPSGAGTVVDHSVTHPTEYDWYLNSHAGLQGTSKSAHYHVLHDDTGTPIDELQTFTYHTTYLYCRHVYSTMRLPCVNLLYLMLCSLADLHLLPQVHLLHVWRTYSHPPLYLQE